MYLYIIGDLHRIPNLFALYNKCDNTLAYNGRKFKKYKKTKKSTENNFKIFKCSSYRYLEAKLIKNQIIIQKYYKK